MDRRTLLAFAAALPMAGSTSALACSLPARSAKSAGRENDRVAALFTAWMLRDRDAFRAAFTERLMNDGTLMDKQLADDLAKTDPLPAGWFDIYDRFFTDTGKAAKLEMLVNTDAGVIACCSERPRSGPIGADCSNMPEQHLFLVTMMGLNARKIAHLATIGTSDPDKFAIWTGD